MKKYVITKKIAKQGSKAVILIPQVLREELRPSTVVRVTLEIVKAPDEVLIDG